ncbi:MAG TPA: VanW family protein [Abditibacteriaceae bacterium]
MNKAVGRMGPLLAALGVLIMAQGTVHSAAPAKNAQVKKAPAKKAPAKKASGKLGKVNVAGVAVSGLTQAEAQRRLRRRLAPRLRSRVVLTGGQRKVSQTRGALGLQLDLGAMLARAKRGDKYVPLLMYVDRPRATNALRRLAPRFRVASRDASVIFQRGRTRIVPERNAQSLNVGASVPAIAAQIQKNPAARVLALRVTKKTPRLTRARLRGITGRLATYSTRFNPGKYKRTRNMHIAINAIDGTLLSPNETFSLNKVVGERTQARGYRTTIIFQNGYKVAGLGGGVSQVTGTLFNAALLSGLPIVTYRTHSRPVAYLPIGRDATVAWGSFDMQFKNNTPAPVYVSYKISGNRATATLFGKANAQRRVSVRVVSKTIGPREKKAQLYRTIREKGKVVSKQHVGTSHYKWNKADWEAD